MINTPVFDVHTHPDNFRNFGSCQNTEGVIAYARRCGISRMVALGDVLRFGARPTEDQVMAINDSTINLTRQYPEIIVGFCFISPFLPADFIAHEIRRCAVDGPLRAIKIEYPNAAGSHHDKVMPVAQEHNLVVLQHAWSASRRLDRTLQTDPADVARLATRYPEVRIIMAHLTGCGPRGVREIAGCPNVWVDTSASQPFSGIIEDALAVLGEDRLLFGTDGPMRDFAVQLGRILDAGLSEQQLEKILYRNAINLLGE